MNLDLQAVDEVGSFDAHPSGVAGQTTRKTRAGRLAAECRVCLGQHDDEIHRATLSVRQWFRDEVTRGLDV